MRSPGFSDLNSSLAVTEKKPPVGLIVLLLLSGVGLFIACGDFSHSVRNLIQFGATLAVVVLAAIPAVNRQLATWLDHIRHPSRRAMRFTTVALSLFAAKYFLYTADTQQRIFIPKFHDEQMYAIQARLVAGGHLWLPAHPLADFFETFHVMVRPVYAPIYFPGTAILFAPTVWFGGHFSFWAALVAGLIVGLTYRIGTELFDGVAGLLAALMMLALPPLHFVSVMIMSHEVALLLGLMLIRAWLGWRREHKRGWALLAGVLAGWLAITRPIDALCFFIPIAVAAAFELRCQPRRHRMGTITAVLVGVMPFLAIQGIFDHAVTGHVLQTPAGAYNQIYWPAAGMGFHSPDPSFHPPTSLIQFQEYYQKRLLPEINAHAKAGFMRALITGVLPSTLGDGLAAPALLLWLPLGLLGLTRRRWAIAAALPLFVILYACYPFVLKHYALAVAPALIILVLAGIEVLRRISIRAGIVSSCAVCLLCLTSLHEINPAVHDPDFPAPFLLDVYQKLGEIKERAIVLFRYTGGGDPDEEPVYNVDVANPDDAPIIRAHDLGLQNVRLFNYYAKLDPDRVIYRYDRKTLVLERLGTARDLAVLAKGPGVGPP